MNMKLQSQRRPRQRGFTLIEMIMTMVMTGILAGIAAVFISGPVSGYLDTVRRGDLMDTADLTLRRLADEIRMALPNSLRITENGALVYIEFIPTIAGGAYLDEYSPPTAVSTKPLVYSDATSCDIVEDNCRFDVVGAMPANPAISAGGGGGD
jgi:MSHA biogenesis protein MshO